MLLVKQISLAMDALLQEERSLRARVMGTQDRKRALRDLKKAKIKEVRRFVWENASAAHVVLLSAIDRTYPLTRAYDVYISTEANGDCMIWTTRHVQKGQLRLVTIVRNTLVCTSWAFQSLHVPFLVTPATVDRIPLQLAMGSGGDTTPLDGTRMHLVTPSSALAMLVHACHPTPLRNQKRKRAQ